MLIRHLLSILVLPTTAAVLVPYLILAGRPGGARLLPAHGPLHLAALVLGAILAAVGLALVVVTVRWFATVGRGTLAPWDPTQRLVVTGVYRHVRNPMISGVLLILLGQAAGFRSAGLLLWAAGFFLLNATWIPLVEEPGLEKRFGETYREYRRHVPRWLPRLTPWAPPDR
jgi:protein-S-isoprenylcysteine O-methyltransferase Ste14